jgi:hypothetical protein
LGDGRLDLGRQDDGGLKRGRAGGLAPRGLENIFSGLLLSGPALRKPYMFFDGVKPGKLAAQRLLQEVDPLDELVDAVGRWVVFSHSNFVILL